MSAPRAAIFSALSGNSRRSARGVVPWRTHPDVALFIGGKYDRHDLRMVRLDNRIRCRGQEAIDQMRAGTGFDFVPRSPLNFVQMRAAGEVAQRPIVVERASFVLVSEFGSGAYSAKLLKGATRRFTGFSHGWLPSSVTVSLVKTSPEYVLVQADSRILDHIDRSGRRRGFVPRSFFVVSTAGGIFEPIRGPDLT